MVGQSGMKFNYAEVQLKNYYKKKMTNPQELINDIKFNIEWLETTDGDSVECISIENLEGALSKFLNKKVKLSQDEES